MRNLRFGIGGVVLLAALVVNPLYACGLFEHRQPLNERMARAIGGRWELRIDGAPAVRYLEITPSRAAPPKTARASLVAPAAACAEITVIAPAAACRPTWTMPLEVVIVGGPVAATGVGRYREMVGASSLELIAGDVQITSTSEVGFFASLEGVPVMVGDLAGTLTRPAP